MPREDTVRAAVTRAQGVMEMLDVPDPGEPGVGEVIVRPEAVGLCGSDFHYFLGDIGGIEDPSLLYPRIQGHEVSAVVDEVGPECPDQTRAGARVALWPVTPCGRCYPCRIGRNNACSNISIIGVHTDGALQERLRVPASQVFPVGDQSAAITAFVEPVSIAVRTVERGRIAEGERVVVLGAGPIGLAIALAALDRGASVLLVDRFEARLELGRAIGADVMSARGDDPFAPAREWAGSGAPEVVIEATGVPELLHGAVELVAQAGRVVVVGLSDRDAPIRVGALPFKEIDILGACTCDASDFANAVALVARNHEAVAALITHEFALDQAPEAIVYAMENPAEVMKAVVWLDGS